ncbi:xanthine permease [Haloferax mediterranei ATCC 33500]|uniref:Xanthine permease n=1 Tax=Haloferax mediterranei (strain ATCC 33500 / DSM 1411 / JCM 8866 / NBRC 14739 / NCIMB 2177 / R-4) TaxID=523841 RepID=I3R3Y8_HALMT|nr:solute carrier family 23 protein [Haloferax mediterranei]AFK18948.1 xanthine/uracil permease family protein [Haloferax mediterranei ATCC 33500]AHZ21690.1 xanthine permease [Haloferax mediterranei ATCC 33500]EMA03194.1 xanthine/uracil permease family protein [Haloferax mediterranei ATCC 33500]MDX5989039.1 solute carrier family 23 protein [Haloferax mediterranei ATCC 33500]QCQ75433.1 xanthine permease [Haloferax mediterranei ATCC 33500]
MVVTDDSSPSSFVQYGIDDKPPLPTALLLGAQHYLTMVGANIAVPLILAGALGMPADVIPRFVGTFFVVSGIATLMQTTFGNRYPIVQGAPFSMLAPAIAVVGVAKATDPSGVAWQSALLQLQGAIIVAALVEVLVGYFGLLGRLRKFISPVVIAPTIALIGLSLFSAPQVTSATNNWWLLGLTLALIVLFSQYLDTAHPAFKLFPVLLGVIVSYVVAAALSVTGFIAPGASGYVNLQTVIDAPAFMPIYPLQWGFAGGAGTTTLSLPVVGSVAFGIPQFSTSFIIGMLAGVAASMVESFGDYHAVARLSGIGAPSERRINHGIGMEGIMNVFSALMGGSGSTSYSENIGAIGLTGVASRYVVQVGAGVMLVMGFVGYFGQLIATIPDPIVGGLYIAMFGQIVAVGLSNLKYVDLDSSRNGFVIGIALFAGLAIPAYMGNVGSAEAFRQGMSQVALVGPVLGNQLVADTIFVIGSTGMAVGGLFAFFFDNTIEGTRVERGLEEWEDTVEDDSEFESAIDRLRGDEPATAD